MRAAKAIGITLLVIIVCLLGASAVALVLFPRQAADFVRPFMPSIAQSIYPAEVVGEDDETSIVATADADLPTEQEEQIYYEQHKGHPKVAPLVAQCDGIDIRTPVDPADITGVLFHQASYPYALVLTTELPAANIEVIGVDNPAYVNREQLEGEWLDAEVMHLWRTGDSTDMDTSIDLGAPAGTPIKSPVTGTVVLVKEYLLYEELPDVEIHIQPDGRPDRDVVLIHTEGPLVKVGDRVEAGITPLSHVRDIASGLTDVQLGFYTAGDDPGNHTHIQVNDVNYPDYREKKLEGALSVG